MGWTSYHATHYKNGKVDRKAECDAYFMEGLDEGHFRVEKSAMVGSVYYAAITRLANPAEDWSFENRKWIELPANEQYTFGVVFLTSVDENDYYNFSYKDMDETMGPCYYDCPTGILKLLSPTDKEYAIKWRNECIKRKEQKKQKSKLKDLPYRTAIRYKILGNTITAVKMPPAYQFKTYWWYVPDKNVYVKKSSIPDEYEVLGLYDEIK
jgi:hypothetical protein